MGFASLGGCWERGENPPACAEGCFVLQHRSDRTRARRSVQRAIRRVCRYRPSRPVRHGLGGPTHRAMARTPHPVYRLRRGGSRAGGVPDMSGHNRTNRQRGPRSKAIVFLTENTPPLKDTRVRSEAAMAVQLGHRVTVIGPSAASTYQEQVVDGITVLGYPPRPSRGGAVGYLREYLSAAVWTVRLLTRVRAAGRIDLVHAANPPDFLLLLALPLKLRGTMLVFDHHDLAPELFEAKFGANATVSRLLRILERLSFRLADAVITTNPSYARVTSERGCRPRRLVIAPNLPELEAFTPVRPDPSLKKGAEYLVVWVGTMGSQDGIDLAVAALGCLAGIRSDWRAVFAGQGEMLLPAQELARSLGVAD